MSNLLPPEEKKSILRMYRKRYVALALAFFGLLGIAGMLMLLPSYRSVLASNASLSEAHDSLAGQGTDNAAASLAGTVSTINSQLKAFPNSEPVSPFVAGLIDPILSAQDKTIHLTDFEYKPGTTAAQATVTVMGTADSRDDLSAFSDKVRALPGFSAVSVPIASFIKDSNESFTLTAIVTLKQQ